MKINILKSTKRLFQNFSKDHISESSAECAYYVILSFIPFIILLVTLIQYTSIEQYQLFNIISNIIPNSMHDFVLGIIKEVYSKSIGTISISIIFTLYSASRGLYALSKELHFIYNYTDKNKKSWIYLKIISLLQTTLFILLITVGLIGMVFGKSIITTARVKFGIFSNYSTFYHILGRVIAIIVTFIIFLLIYKFMSNHKIKLRKQILGAAFASIFLNLISHFFSKYLEIFKGFSTTYGSLTTILLILMWVYSCFYIIFCGAEINKIYGTKEKNILETLD